jgi:hypothetical protein
MTARTKACKNYPSWEKLSATRLGQKKVNKGEHSDKTQATTAPFPSGIAGNDRLHPILHNLF